MNENNAIDIVTVWSLVVGLQEFYNWTALSSLQHFTQRSYSPIGVICDGLEMFRPVIISGPQLPEILLLASSFSSAVGLNFFTGVHAG